MSLLAERVAADLAKDLPHDIRSFARQLAESSGAVAVLFYGSVLRTGKLEELLDFYVLTDSNERAPHIWPRISFPVISIGARTLRAKVAMLPLSVFAKAASGRLFDTTIWSRFCQPSALAWARDADATTAVAAAVADTIVTAASYAAVLGPKSAPAATFWKALFDRTYEAELRVEAPGRSATIVSHDPERYAEILPLAWFEAGIRFSGEGNALRPVVPARTRRALVERWRRRATLGKPLNAVRLVRAALTLHDAAGYALWKIERHTGVRIEATRWRREHPLLAAPGVLWQLSRARAQQRRRN